MPRLSNRSKIGVCFFMESNLGGAATQADDLVTTARRLGYESCLLRFATSPRAKDLWKYNDPGLPQHKLQIRKGGIRFESPRLLISPSTIDQAVKWLNRFELLIFVGACPHITRSFSLDDFHEYYKPIYTETKCRKFMFFTDPFWQKLYPFAKDVVGQMTGVYAFAEAYRRAVMESGLTNGIAICNFGSVAACDAARSTKKRNSKDVIVWPHQWRSWKNPETLILTAPYLERHVNAYADGIEYYLLRRDNWEDWKAAVDKDHIMKQSLNPEGNVTVFGNVVQSQLIDEFSTCRWMIDLTGMSGRTGKPIEKFVGNYQCVNIECMMLGCVNFKYENTIAPYSQIPADCVISMPLITDPKELAHFINKNLGYVQYQRVADKAKSWSMSRFNPEQVFQKCFIDPFKRGIPR